jgi:Zn-dependent M28 family amino/carboxypeptidase
MKHLISIFLLVFLFSCKPTDKLSKENSNTGYISNHDVWVIIDTLASDYMEGRRFGSTGNEKAAVYIENFMVQNHIKPYFKQYRDSFTAGAGEGYNVIGLIEGIDPILKNEYIILSAHYDHIGKSSDKNDSVYNGANDNASGVSGVLNISKYLKIKNLNKRSIIVALFSGEEIGLTGSDHFADKISPEASHIYCDVNIDMIGSVLTNKPGKIYISGFDKSNMSEIFNKYTGNDNITSIELDQMYGLFRLSDNYPLYEKLNIPAHTFCTFDFSNYEHYHRLTDEVKNLDIENAGIIIRNIALCVSKLSCSDKKEIVLTKN